MKRILLVLIVAASACGCSYYRVTDPASGRTYYTNNWMAARSQWSGAVRFTDATGKDVTLQSSEVERCTKEEYMSAANVQ